MGDAMTKRFGVTKFLIRAAIGGAVIGLSAPAAFATGGSAAKTPKGKTVKTRNLKSMTLTREFEEGIPLSGRSVDLNEITWGNQYGCGKKKILDSAEVENLDLPVSERIV